MEKIDLEKYDYKRNLLFTWPTGTGKTTKAKELLKKTHNPEIHEKLQKYFITDSEFKQLVKNNSLSLRKPTETWSNIESYPMEMMIRSWVLLYDDIGVSDATEPYLRDLTYILDKRIDRKLPTIFTTNLKKDELKEKLNERIVSRILYNTDVVIFQGDDRRLETTRYFIF